MLRFYLWHNKQMRLYSIEFSLVRVILLIWQVHCPWTWLIHRYNKCFCIEEHFPWVQSCSGTRPFLAQEDLKAHGCGGIRVSGAQPCVEDRWRKARLKSRNFIPQAPEANEDFQVAYQTSGISGVSFTKNTMAAGWWSLASLTVELYYALPTLVVQVE